MPSISFSTGTTITAAWLNDVNAVVYSVFNALSSAPSSGKVLRSNGTSVVGSTFTMPDTYTANSLIYASALNTIAALATANSSMLVTDGSGVPSWVAFTGSGAPVRGTSPTIGTPAITSPTITGTIAGSPTISTPTIDTPTITGTATAQGLIDISGAAAGQIKFPATQNASANANTLDDYEEGTWTPSVGGTATYVTQIGEYTKIGRMVFARFAIQVNVIGTGSTTDVLGLPFTSLNTNDCPWATRWSNATATAVVYLVAYVRSFGTSLGHVSTAAAATSLALNATFGSATAVQAAGSYHTS